MKKLIFVLVFLAFISPVFAEDSEATIYYINVPVEKIIPSKEGYIVQYRSSSSVIATVGIPNEWFYDAASVAEKVRLGVASDWPTMSIFYLDGKFSHLKLYVHPVKSHQTWGSVPQGTDLSRFFTDKESFKIRF
ncbi:MAG: hypothetical protein FWD22_04445 [Treponema sp.]|nr:hypothetical protein [Treponema sp.]